MKHLLLPPGHTDRKLPFFLAMEEWAAARLAGINDDIFFLWQVDPTVIFGRNQRIEMEVDLDYCRNNGIQFYRRKSGGGCVFADRNNIMFSYITTAGDVVSTFAHYTGIVASFLRSLGLNASNTGRNDVLIDDRKVSGYAFYNMHGRCISHGTMLFDADMTHISRAITPSRSKLESKGVQSVQSRITTIREHLPDLDIETFKRLAVERMTDGDITLSENDIREIEELEKAYYDQRWIYGSHHSSTVSRYARIEGVGEFHADIDIRNGHISHVNLSGDFFMTGDLDSDLLDRLRGIEFSRQSILTALSDTTPSDTIPGLSADALATLLCP